jgi:hypothetical protein
MNSDTDPGPGGAAIGRALAISLAVALLPVPWPASSAAAMTPSALRSTLDKTDRTIAQAEKAVTGKDPGKVSLYLARVDELLVSFQDDTRLADLAKSFDQARASARASEWPGAASAVRRGSALMTPLSDYVVLRQAAESSRAALQAADAHDLTAFLDSVDRFDASILAPVMLARVREAREAIGKARQAMVHNNMPDGQKRIGEVRRAMNGLFHAGALSRAVFALSIGAEMLETGSAISAKDQLQRALRDLKLAADTGPQEVRPTLEETRTTTADIWKRVSRATPDDAKRTAELARTVDAIRLKQPR